MSTNLLTTGDAEDEESIEFTVVAGTPTGICLKDVSDNASCVLLKKDDIGTFQETSTVMTWGARDGTLVAPGIYKLRRKTGSCGAFRD